MIIICAGWKRVGVEGRVHVDARVLGEKEPIADLRVSHGMCGECEQILNADMDAEASEKQKHDVVVYDGDRRVAGRYSFYEAVARLLWALRRDNMPKRRGFGIVEAAK